MYYRKKSFLKSGLSGKKCPSSVKKDDIKDLQELTDLQ